LQEKVKGPRGQLFLKLFVDDDPHGASEPQEGGAQDGDGTAQEEDPGTLRKKIELLSAKIDAMSRTLAMARQQAIADQTEIANLQNQIQSCTQELQQTSLRLQTKINELNNIAAQNKKLQSEFKTAKLNLEREKAGNSLARLAYDTSLTSRELAVQLELLADAGNPPPSFFHGLLQARNKALADSNNRAKKADTARATAEASAKEESKKLHLQIQNLKAQVEEYQNQLHSLQQQHQQSTQINNRKRSAPPPTWQQQQQVDGDFEEFNQPRKQQKQQQQNNPNFLRTAVPPASKPPSRVVSSRTIGIGGLATKANPRAAVELEAEIEGLIGPSSELPSMHFNVHSMMPPPAQPPPSRRRVNVNNNNPRSNAVEPLPVVAAVDEEDEEGAARVLEPPLVAEVDLPDKSNTIDPDPSGIAPHAAPDYREQVRQRLLARKQAEAGDAPLQLAASAPPPPLSVSNGENPDSIEWGTEVENAAADVDEEEDVIELIDSDEEETLEERSLPAAAPAPAAKDKPAVHGVENDPRVLNQHPQQRPLPSKATISFLAAGPSKIAHAGAPGTSFIKDPKFATTGLKDDATYIRCGPDGRGGRTTHYTGNKMNNNRAPAWGGGVITDHVPRAGGCSGASGSGSGGQAKRVKGGNAGGSKPISKYFGPSKPAN
jgi:hypothetical protein